MGYNFNAVFLIRLCICVLYILGGREWLRCPWTEATREEEAANLFRMFVHMVVDVLIVMKFLSVLYKSYLFYK